MQTKEKHGSHHVFEGAGLTQGFSGDELDAETLAGLESSMFRDIDAILARLDVGIAAEHSALDALLQRLQTRAV